MKEDFGNTAPPQPQRNEINRFIMAARNNDLAGVEDFLRRFGKRHVDSQGYGHTALNYAASKGNLEIVKILLKNGASMERKSVGGHTALHWAAQDGHPEVARFLLGNGSPIDAKNNAGETPLMLAAAMNHGDIARLLLDHGASLDEKDNRNETALDQAELSEIFTNYADIIPMLKQERTRRAKLAAEVETRRLTDEAVAAVYAGIAEDMDIAVPLRFKKKGPVPS
jgi:ankyrin repeat protein